MSSEARRAGYRVFIGCEKNLEGSGTVVTLTTER